MSNPVRGLLGGTQNAIGRVLFRVGWWLRPECGIDECTDKIAAHDVCAKHARELHEVEQEVVE